MGMFDNVDCAYYLPDYPEDWPRNTFQTKDLDCQLDDYVISADGKLLKDGELVNYTGAVDFYNSNFCACSHGVTFTSQGEDYQSFDYKALFQHGHLLCLELTSTEREPALPTSWRWEHAASSCLYQEPRKPKPESLLNRRLFLQWGGLAAIGYYVTVMQENERDLVCQDDSGKIEIVGSYQYGNCLHEDEESCIAAKHARDKQYQVEREAYQEALRLHVAAKGLTAIKF